MSVEMTLYYNVWFLLVWGAVTLAIPGVAAAIVWIVMDQSELSYAVGIPIAVFALLYTVAMRTHSPRVLVRSGAWPACFCRDYFPRTEKELVRACDACMKLNGRPPSVVGGGWSYFLWRRGARGPRLFLHNFKGMVEQNTYSEGQRLLSGNERWRSGTTIESALSYYEKLGYTFSTHPTMSYITLGAWFAAGNHGNGGESAMGSSKTMDVARVLNMHTGQIMEWNYKTLRRTFDSNVGADYCVIDISFQNMMPNKIVQKRALVVNSVNSAQEWLTSRTKSASHLRVLFQGAARNYSLGLSWHDPYDNNDHSDPHCCSRFGQWMQADVASVWLGWREPLSAFGGKSTYRNANNWMPLLLPFMESYAVLRGYRNFEIIFQPGSAMTGIYLHELTSSLRELHSQIGGRSEIRYGRDSADQCVFLDCVFTKSFYRIFQLLYSEFNIKSVALHPGKHHPPTSPCVRVHLASVYGFTKDKGMLVQGTDAVLGRQSYVVPL